WFSVANLVVAFLLFTTTQSPSIQHTLPFGLWYLFVIVAGLMHGLARLPQRARNWSGVVLLAASTAAMFTALYRTTAPGPVAEWLLPESSTPLHLSNYSSYDGLALEIDRRLQPGEKFTVLASSMLLSDDLMLSVGKGR